MPTEEAPLATPEEQFATAEQQRETVKLGMWIFLATEVLFFGGFFLAYFAYRHWYYVDFSFGSRHLDFFLGTTNTAVLLTSSFLMAGAVSAARLFYRRTTIALLLMTAALGVVFLCIKGYEWFTAISDGYWPASPNGHISRGVHLFYSLYFGMTGLHGLHLFVGVAFLLGTACVYKRKRDRIFRPNQNYLMLLGLYWHFVDIVWIFLYPLLYFIGRAS